MNFLSTLSSILFLFTSVRTASAFCSPTIITSDVTPTPTTTRQNRSHLFFQKNNPDNINSSFEETFQKITAGTFAAAAIFTSTLFSTLPDSSSSLSSLFVANAADLQLSKGAFIVQTSNKPGQSLIKAEIDSQSLIKTVLQNRRDIGSSIGRIQNAVQSELSTSTALKDIQKEILDIEGDVLPSVTITPPADLTQTVKDLSQGRVNFLVNG